uniref:POX domain-containing protein n=1 Tax=Oryza punctata TaxID=4537 RepID=A0A0E0K821_ORYPU
MDPVIAATGYKGTANTDGFLFSDSALHNVYSEDQFSSIKQLHPSTPSTTGRSRWLEENNPVIHQRTSAAASSDIGSSVLHKPSLFPSIIDCLDKEPLPIHQSDGRYSYDNYLSHLTSCSTSLNYGLSMPSVAASHVVCGMTRTDPSSSDPVLEGRFLQYANPCTFNIGHFDSVEDEQKDHAGFQTAYRHCGNCNRSTNSTGMVGNYLVNSSGETCNVGENSITGRLAQENLCSEMPMSRGQEPLSHRHSLVQEDLNAFSENITYRCYSHAELIKSMYNLSVALLSSCNGDYELGESYQELIQSVIQNLSSLSPKISKMRFTPLIEAEASMCKLKYELQLARMELALKCHSQQTVSMGTLKSGDDSMNSVVLETIKEQVESSNTNVDTSAPFFAAVKRISDYSSSSDVDFDKFLSSIKKQTYVTFMARHKDFVCHKGNIRSLDDTTNRCQAASNAKQLEYDALEFVQSLKILEGRP